MKIGRDGGIRTHEPLTPSREKGGNSGQPKTAAPDFIGVLSSPQPPETISSRYRLSAVCHRLLIAKLATEAELDSRLPISRPSARVHDRNDQDSTVFDAVHDAEWETLQEVSTRSVVERRPRLRQSRDCRFGRVKFATECRSRSYAALGVPARRSLCFVERFFEVLKLAGHGGLPRGCDDVPPTRKWSWRFPRRRDRAAYESRRTTPPRRRRRRRLRGFESARRRARPALRQTVEVLRRGAAWRPYGQH